MTSCRATVLGRTRWLISIESIESPRTADSTDSCLLRCSIRPRTNSPSRSRSLARKISLPRESSEGILAVCNLVDHSYARLFIRIRVSWCLLQVPGYSNDKLTSSNTTKEQSSRMKHMLGQIQFDNATAGRQPLRHLCYAVLCYAMLCHGRSIRARSIQCVHPHRYA